MKPPERATAPAGAAEAGQESTGGDRHGDDTSAGAAVTAMLNQYVGRRIPGGCEHCDAYQTIELLGRPSPDSPAQLDAWHRVAAEMGIPGDGPGSIHFATVHHDDDCPWWLQRQNRAARRAAHKRSKRRRH